MSFLSNLTKPLESFKTWLSSPRKHKLVYRLNEGRLGDEKQLSRKGVGLCEISRQGFEVPSTFLIAADSALEYRSMWPENRLPDILLSEIHAHISEMERATGRKFGAIIGPLPLLVSVRAGTLIPPSVLVSYEDSLDDTLNKHIVDMLGVPDSWSIPGVKESCLGIGLNDDVVEHLAKGTSPRFAFNTYCHFLLRFGSLILGAPRASYHQVLKAFVDRTGRTGTQLTEEDLVFIANEFKSIQTVPADPFEQLELAIREMYCFWFSTTAIQYRCDALDISDELGLALIVQSMVFGSVGICFSRDPISGEKGVFGSYWPSASGCKYPLSDLDGQNLGILSNCAQCLEKHFRDAVQFEFVIDDVKGTQCILQAHTARRTVKASVRMAVDMVEEKVLTEREALLRIDAQRVADFFAKEQRQTSSSPTGGTGGIQLFASGVAASQGIATGVIAFSSQECMQLAGRQREKVILCLQDSKSSDARAIRAADAVITVRGDVLSNAAILCRGMGKPCITGIHKNAHFSESPDGRTLLKSTVSFASGTAHTLRSGSIITVDGGEGKVYVGSVPTTCFMADPSFQKILSWSDQFRKMRILSNISCKLHLLPDCASEATRYATLSTDLVDQVRMSFQLGADGVGCLHTDNLFCFNEESLSLTRRILINAMVIQHQQQRVDSAAIQTNELQSLLLTLGNIQKQELIKLFQTAAQYGKGGTINVKLLDKALCCFLPSPKIENEIVAAALHLNVSVAELKLTSEQLHDRDPDFGFMGCRISAFCPEIIEMQVRAILSANLEVLLLKMQNEGLYEHLFPNILIPAVTTSHEVDSVKKIVDRVATQVIGEYRTTHQHLVALIDKCYTLGVIMGTPRACLRAETILADPSCTFLSFDVAQLTACTFGCSREDSEKFFSVYKYEKIYLADPFQSLDDQAVGQLLEAALLKARNSRQRVHCSIGQGEHTADARSIAFFNDMGFDSITVPPHGLPVARISAAQAEIRRNQAMEIVADWDEDLSPGFLM